MKDSLCLHFFPDQYFIEKVLFTNSAIYLNPLPFSLANVKINIKALLLVNTSKSGS